MAKEYITVNGKLLMTDNKLVQVPDSENLNDLADENNLKATLMSDTVDEVEDLIVNGVIDGSPKGVYANLSALQNAFPTGAIGVYITRNDGHWYFWDGSAWTDGGVYQSSNDLLTLTSSYDPIATGSILATLRMMSDDRFDDGIYLTPESNTLIIYKYNNHERAWVYGSDEYSGCYYIGDEAEGVFKQGDTTVYVDKTMSATSTNPIQNKVVKAYIDNAITGALTEDY